MDKSAGKQNLTHVKEALRGLSLTEKQHLYQLLRGRVEHRQRACGNKKILVSFVTVSPAPETSQPDSKQLKLALRNHLPDYAIPEKIYTLARMPKLVNGKIDKSKLKSLAEKYLADDMHPAVNAQSGKISAESARCESSMEDSMIEQPIIDAWQQVLGRLVTSPDDNFFELGGDSILSIHLVSRLLQAGYRVGPNDLFEYPCIGQLSEKLAANSSDDPGEIRMTPADGAPVTPIQAWFFETIGEHHEQWNMARLFKLADTVDVQALRNAVNRLAHGHDVFSVSFIRETAGYRHKLNDVNAVSFTTTRLAPESSTANELLKQAETEQSMFNLSRAPLIRFVLLYSDFEKFLLVTAHHLVMDIISWQILEQDLQHLLIPGNSDKPLAQATPFTAWADYQNSLASSAEIKMQAEFWNSQYSHDSSHFPFNQNLSPDSLPVSLEANVKVIRTRLEQDFSAKLVIDAHQNYQTTTPDLLLTAFVLAIFDSYGRTQITIDIESHGRFDPGERIDLSRTIGWFSSVYPLLLACDPGPSNRDALIAATIKSTKENLRKVRYGGISYGLLKQAGQLHRYAGMTQARILFNYMGSKDMRSPQPAENAPLVEMALDIHGQRHPDNQRSHFIEIQSYFSAGQLYAEWHYDACLIDDNVAGNFAHHYLDNLRQIIEHCQQTQHASYTPSDFPDAGLDQQALDDFLGSIS